MINPRLPSGPCWNCGAPKENTYGLCSGCGRFGLSDNEIMKGDAITRKWIVYESLCRKCGKKIEMAEKEVDWWRGRQLTLPNLCADCRRERRMYRRQELEKRIRQEEARKRLAAISELLVAKRTEIKQIDEKLEQLRRSDESVQTKQNHVPR
jgi:chromosome segregation ATPase